MNKTTSRLKYLFLSNAMLAATLVCIIVGVWTATHFSHLTVWIDFSEEVRKAVLRFDLIFIPPAVLIIVAAILWYEWPMRRYLRAERQGNTISPAQTAQARRRVLSEPYFNIITVLMVWAVAASCLCVIVFKIDNNGQLAGLVAARSFLTGVISQIAAFFLNERLLQRSMAPVFFPAGKLWASSNRGRIWIGTRLSALTAAVSVVPFCVVMVTAWGSKLSLFMDPADNLNRLHQSLFVLSAVFIVIAFGLTILVTLNLIQPLRKVIAVLRGVSNGRYDRKIRVNSNDEIGYAGDVINEMTEGLQEREQMRQALMLAEEIQQNLLPQKNPQIPGLDIAGKLIYCDETGGDYYDFVTAGDSDQTSKVGVVVGDVTGHGVASSLLMATARAFIRQRASLPGDLGQIITDVNRQFSMDVEDSGQFMTLFYLAIDRLHKELRWVRAGHDPAIFYDPATADFTEIGGRGLTLGVDEDWEYEEHQKSDLVAGQIIVLGTDGLWEAHDRDGKMFGKEQIFQIIRDNCTKSADQINTLVLDALEAFLQGHTREDDITLVVIKIT